MALFLVQHGISASKDIDLEKGLSDFGREETNRIAQVAKGYKTPIQKIVHSGKKRAEQTADIFHEALALETPMKKISGINPMDDVRSFAATIEPKGNLMVVGHMPFMERLIISNNRNRKLSSVQVSKFWNCLPRYGEWGE